MGVVVVNSFAMSRYRATSGDDDIKFFFDIRLGNRAEFVVCVLVLRWVLSN